MQFGLQARLLLSLLILLFGGIGAMGYVLVNDADKLLTSFRQTQALYQARTLAESSVNALASEDFELLEEAVSSAMPSEDYAFAMVVRGNGQILSHSAMDRIGNRVSEYSHFSKGKEKALIEESYKDRPVMVAVYPVMLGKRLLATAHVAYYLDIENALFKNDNTHMMFVLVITLLIFSGATFFITRRVTEPIKNLIRGVHDFSLDKVATIETKELSRNDEVGELARSFFDVSHRLVDAHHDLMESGIENKTIIDVSLDGILTIDQFGIIESINPAASQMFDYSPRELIGKNINILMPEPDHSKHDTYIKRYLETGQAHIIGESRELIAKRKDGSLFPVHLAVAELTLNSKIKFMGRIHDISKRKAYEEELINAKEKAEEGNRVKMEFLSVMSHELRTPMHGVIGMLDLLQFEATKPELKEYIGIAQKSALAMTDLLGDILEFSKNQSGKATIKNAAFSYTDTMKSVTDLFATNAKEKQISLSMNVSSEIPETLLGNSVHLRQIIGNLVCNAIKFTNAGSITIDACVVKEQGNHIFVRAEVKDTGMGVAEENKETIFEAFTQADTSDTRKYDGTGLGLAICKQFALQMGGEIGLDSTLGAGSTFWVTIPFEKTEDHVVETNTAEDNAVETNVVELTNR